MKKAVAIVLVLACLICLVACSNDKAVGTISGAENDYILYNKVTYVMDTSNNFSNKDRGEYLGKVINDKVTMKIYTVKGDENMDYLYALWDWEGSIYVRENPDQ